jgi:hypothetical protein
MSTATKKKCHRPPLPPKSVAASLLDINPPQKSQIAKQEVPQPSYNELFSIEIYEQSISSGGVYNLALPQRNV